jgi:hypothetical protein
MLNPTKTERVLIQEKPSSNKTKAQITKTNNRGKNANP